MSTTPTSRFNFKESVEKILIALVFLLLLGIYLIGGVSDVKESTAFKVVLSLELVLIGFYIYKSRNLLSVFFLAWILLIVGYLLKTSMPDISSLLQIAGKAGQFCFGVYLAIKTVKESMRNKDWELFGTLLTLALIFPFVDEILKLGKDIAMVYSFSVSFMLGTILYNENLWDKYNSTEKKLLLFILVYTLVDVLCISIKML